MSAAAPAQAASPVIDTSTANADYMTRSRRFPVRMPLVGGNLNGPYAVNSTLNFIMGPVNNGWMDTLDIDVNIQITMTTAAATANKGYPWNLVAAITVNLDGQISYVEPYELYLLERVRGRLRAGVDTVLAGGQNTSLQNIVFTAPTTLAIGANNIRFRIRCPLNALHPLDGAGLLPTQGTQDPVQINIITATTIIGVDPWIHPATSGTGTAAVTGTSTVTVYGWVRDGRTYWSPQEQLPFYPDGLPQVSYDREPDLVNLVANNIVRTQLTKVLRIYYMFSIIIDGQSSAQFATNANINSWDLSADSSGNFKLRQFGLENVPMDLLFEDIRMRFGQDFPEGVIPVVFAPQDNLPMPDVGNGTNILNMMAGGWTSLYQGINLAAIGGVAGIQPRVHTLIIGANDSPYVG